MELIIELYRITENYRDRSRFTSGQINFLFYLKALSLSFETKLELSLMKLKLLNLRNVVKIKLTC